MSVVGIQRPRIEKIPDFTVNDFADVVELCSSYGLILDDWQEYVLKGSLGEDEAGKWAASRVGLSVPRQSGKTALFEARELAGLCLFGDQLIIHSAHLVPTALEAFRRMKAYFDNWDDLRKKVYKIREANGEQAIELLNGQRLRFMARQNGQGRGFSCDTLMLDEAQELSEDTWSDILPSMAARDNPQAWIAGTPPSEKNNGEVFTLIRDAGMSGVDERLCWMEWSADPESDFDDHAAWAQANPALGIRVPLNAIQDERNSMSDVKFGRERLGIWGAKGSARVISAEAWESIAMPTAQDAGGQMAIAVDMAPDGGMASLVSVSAVAGGFPCIDLIDTKVGSPEWVIPRIVEACRRFNVRAVVIDGAGPASELIDPLRNAKIEPTVTNSSHMKRACGQFYTAAVTVKNLRHLNQAGLNVAVGAARKRKLEDMWAWSRKDPESDITPVVAATLALWGFTAVDVKKPLRKSGGATFV